MNDYYTKYPEYITVSEDYWKRRLEDREYDVIKFRNGYAKDAPTMLVEYEGYDIGFTGICEEKYMINLGKVIEVNYGKNNS